MIKIFQNENLSDFVIAKEPSTIKLLENLGIEKIQSLTDINTSLPGTFLTQVAPSHTFVRLRDMYTSFWALPITPCR